MAFNFPVFKNRIGFIDEKERKISLLFKLSLMRFYFNNSRSKTDIYSKTKLSTFPDPNPPPGRLSLFVFYSVVWVWRLEVRMLVMGPGQPRLVIKERGED